MTEAKAQGSLGGDFDELWTRFEGQKVTAVILNFAGEVSVTDQETAAALGYLEEVEFLIRGRITGKKHSYRGGTTRGQAIVQVESVELGDHVFETKVAERLKKAAEAQDVTPPGPEAPQDARSGRNRRRKDDPVWDELDRQDESLAAATDGLLCGKVHRGHLNPCAILAVDCDLASIDELDAAIAHAEKNA